jgi:non-heme chloroperoxidase
MAYLVTADGVRLRVSDRGAGDPPIVLVHGWKGAHRLWDRVVVELQSRHRVVSFDLRGMGESDKPRCAYDFDELASDLGEVLSKLDLEAATLVGWSMGGTVCLRYLETDGDRVARLVLLNSPIRLTRAPDFPHTMTEEELDAALAELARGWPASERAFQASTTRRPEPDIADLLYRTALQTPLDVALATVGHQRKLDMRDVVRGLDVPVMAAYSEHDPYYPVSLGEFIAAAAPHGKLMVFSESAHATPLEEPRTLAQAIAEFSS